jgi:hypothetical protein
MDRDGRATEGDDDRVGIFPSWRALYWTVAVYAVLLVAALQYITIALDHTGP